MKATIEYNSGLMLIIPKDEKCSLSFMEWCSNYNSPLKIIHKIINDVDKNVFKIRLNGIREDYENLKEYINKNLAK